MDAGDRYAGQYSLGCGNRMARLVGEFRAAGCEYYGSDINADNFEASEALGERVHDLLFYGIGIRIDLTVYFTGDWCGKRELCVGTLYRNQLSLYGSAADI